MRDVNAGKIQIQNTKKDKLKAEIILRDIKQVYIEKDILATLKIGKHLAFSGLMD
jgi:hypothetical protein